MGMRWEDDAYECFRPKEPRWTAPALRPWQYTAVGFATGFATCFLAFVPQ